MFCPSCGQEIPENAKFCGHCRHQLQQEKPVTPGTASRSRHETVVVDSAQRTVSPGMKWGIMAATLFIPLIGFIMGIVYMLQQNNSDEKKAVGKMWLVASLVIGVLYILGSSGY